MEEVWKEFDINDEGQISTATLSSMFTSILSQFIKKNHLHYLLNVDDLKPIVDRITGMVSSHLDKDGSGTIDKDEFCNIGEWLLNLKTELVQMGQQAGGFT